jgi:hypothetical protein
MVGPSVTLAINRDSCVVHRSSTQEVAVKSVTVFQFEQVWRDRMAKQILTNMGMIGDALNAML